MIQKKLNKITIINNNYHKMQYNIKKFLNKIKIIKNIMMKKIKNNNTNNK